MAVQTAQNPLKKELLKFQISSRRMPIQNFKLIIRILQDRIGFDKLSEQDFALCLKTYIGKCFFTILSACGIEISDHEFSFDYINQFVSIKTLSVLGTKLMILARGVLAEIGKTVCIYDKLREKEQEKEISKKNLQMHHNRDIIL